MSSQQAKSVLSENIDQVSVFFFFLCVCVLKEECGALQNIEQLSTIPKVERQFPKKKLMLVNNFRIANTKPNTLALRK